MNNPITQSANNPINGKNENEKIFDIHERIYRWVIQVINYSKKLPKTSQNLIIIPQLIKSVTSVGANDQEADAANSRKDFIAKYAIVRKECKESLYWLHVIHDTNPEEIVKGVMSLLQEGKEIGFIVSTIMSNTRK